jgi:hypothetical protein
VPLSVNPGETFYVGVWHYDYGTATNGVYDISVGPFLSSGPTGQAKAGHRIYLPITLKNDTRPDK